MIARCVCYQQYASRNILPQREEKCKYEFPAAPIFCTVSGRLVVLQDAEPLSAPARRIFLRRKGVVDEDGVLPDHLDVLPADDGVLLPAEQPEKAQPAADDDRRDRGGRRVDLRVRDVPCLLYTSDAADE